MNWTGFFALIDRETTRFMRLSRQTVAPPLITTIMFILIFGYSLGSRIREIEGVSYIVYILPGLIQMGIITNAYANSSTSLFMARMERSLENLMVSPLNYFQIVTAYLLGGVLRGLVVGFTIMACSAFFIDYPKLNWPLVLLSFVATSTFFSGLGIISALRAESWDKIATFTNFVITPFVYLGGVFYSIHMLPPFWESVSHFNPIFYCVDVARMAFLGQSDAPVLLSLGIVLFSAAMVYGICLLLFKRGYKIVK